MYKLWRDTFQTENTSIRPCLALFYDTKHFRVNISSANYDIWLNNFWLSN